MNFAQKLTEQVQIAQADPEHAVAQTRSLLNQFADWPLSTMVPLTRVAQLIAGLACELPANVRRLVATDTVRLVDQA